MAFLTNPVIFTGILYSYSRKGKEEYFYLLTKGLIIALNAKIESKDSDITGLATGLVLS